MNREFLMLAQNYSPGIGLANWFASEKLDGMRAWWDGGITRGMFADEVAWANTEKDGRYISRPVATGLWSRYGKPIAAPDWWLDKLPPFPLDGELYAGRKQFQFLMSTVKQLIPDSRWKSITYQVFDSPAWSLVLADGRINGTNYKKVFQGISTPNHPIQAFEATYAWLQRNLPSNEVVSLHAQTQLPWTNAESEVQLSEMLAIVTAAGGEGLIVRHPSRIWEPRRVSWMLKIKPFLESEGIIRGYIWGEETDKGSKLAGLMGSLIVQWKGHVFALSGFTDEERKLTFFDSGIDASDFWEPGCEVQSEIHNPRFPRGRTIRFMYRETTDAGKPKEARYFR